MHTLLLDDKWDLSLTVGGNLAATGGEGKEETYRIVQDVSCYERVFKGEGFYDVEAGVPYLDRELAHMPPQELVRERARRRALEVPGVAAASVTLTALDKRTLHGNIHITTTYGETFDVAI